MRRFFVEGGVILAMQQVTMWKNQFNWRMLLIRILVNAFALAITVMLVPKIYFVDRSLRTWLLLALALGVLNAFIKPIIQFATLRYIFATYGVVLALINAILLFLLSLLLPNRFAVDGVIWALVGGAVIGIVSAVFENLFGLTPPIVSEKHPEVRRRIKEKETGSLKTHLTVAAVEKTLAKEPGEVVPATPTTDAAAVLAAVGAGDKPSSAPASPAAPVAEAVVMPQELAPTAAPPAEQEA